VIELWKGDKSGVRNGKNRKLSQVKLHLEKAIEQNHQKWYRFEIFSEGILKSIQGADKNKRNFIEI